MNLEAMIEEGRIFKCWFYHHITNGHQFTMSNRHQKLTSPEANDFCKELASPKQTALEQMATGKEKPNPFMAGSLPKNYKANLVGIAVLLWLERSIHWDPHTNMPTLEATGIFDGAFDDRDLGVEADTNNLESSIVFSPIPTTRVHKDHPKEQIIGDPNLNTQTRRMIKFSDETAMTTSTPMETSKPLLKDEDGQEVDVHMYRSMIGSLMYLTSSRPYIMFVVCACARHQVSPKASHLHAVKRIFRYLKRQPNLGLWYPKDSSFKLEAYTDSDYAGSSLDRKSVTGGCQFLGCRLISWQCKKHAVVANSTTEAEYVILRKNISK
nr:uncharacterized mitochondrial protein AtMg00810-like [Tanacetum cinerariifolium]